MSRHNGFPPTYNQTVQFVAKIDPEPAYALWEGESVAPLPIIEVGPRTVAILHEKHGLVWTSLRDELLQLSRGYL